MAIHVNLCYQSTLPTTKLAENDIKLSNFCQKATKAPEDVKRIEIDRTDRWNIVNILRNTIKKLNNLCDFASLKIYTKLKSNYTYKLF